MGFLFTHVADLGSGVAVQFIELYRMIEDGAELIMDGLEIDGGIKVSVRVTLFEHHILPRDDIPWLDVAHSLFLEVRKNLAFDHAGLHLPCALLQSILEILFVKLIESLKGHFQVSCALSEKVAFPIKGFFLCSETSLGFAVRFTLPVCETELRIPCSILVFVSTHFIYLLEWYRF